MRRSTILLLLVSSHGALAQAPPITLEWSALRWYDGGPNARITRDPVHNQYIWAVYQNFQGASDESAFPFLPDGTDLAPSNPQTFNEGSLDGLVDVAVYDSTIHRVMHHQYTGGSPQDVLWHIDGIVVQSADPYLADVGSDLLVTNEGIYSCGRSDTHYAPDSSVARALKIDHSGNLLWNVTWADPASAHAGFTSVAVIGDSVFCAAFPNLVIFDRVTGAFIDAYDFTNQTPALIGDAELLAKGSRLYWGMSSGDVLHFGQFDFAINQGQVASVVVADQIGYCNIAVDDQDRLWLTSNSDGQGRWFRWDADLEPDGTGTLYESIDDVCFVNGKISFTGVLDSSTPTVYVITGTPQP